MDTIHGSSRYGAILGVYHEWHPIAFRLLQLIGASGSVGISPIYQLAGKAVAEWEQRQNKDKELNTNHILGALLLRYKENPSDFSIDDVYYHSVPNVFAGGETTGAALTATMYFLCREPEVLQKLRSALKGIKDTRGRVPMKAAQDCKYLQAVLKESLRMFPATGLGMPRIVPKGGLTLVGYFFPEGVSSTCECH